MLTRAELAEMARARVQTRKSVIGGEVLFCFTAEQLFQFVADCAKDNADARRYQQVKKLTKEQLLLWRGAYAFDDQVIDDMRDPCGLCADTGTVWGNECGCKS